MNKELFVTWNTAEEGQAALSKAYHGIEKVNAVIMRTKASPGTFRDISVPNTSVRDGMTRRDYDYFRPDERIPTEAHEIQKACMEAYERFGIVRNIVDMMSDFVVKGIDVVHKSERIQEFGRQWFKKVAGPSISSKIATMLFKAAAAPVRRVIGKLPDITIQSLKDMKAKAYIKPEVNLKDGEIPIGYSILNPVPLEVIGGDLALFLGEDKIQYGVRIPRALLKKIKTPKSNVEINIVNLIPKDLIKNASVEDGLIPIPKNRLSVLHYKKDDFVLWAKPIIYPILDDLFMLDKLKLADRAALDGAISHVRLWRLGSLEYKIAPTATAVQRLSEMLLNNVGGGCMDLIWGPELDLIETGTETYRFLGNDKYIPTLTSIFQGLGVPPTLTGTSADAGFTNNFISLKILVERLGYCRSVLVEFWEQELQILQSVFGWRDAFTLTFDVPNLSDDSGEKKLLLDMLDRNAVSEEFVQERFGADPAIERVRLKRQERMRKQGKMPPKAGPYHLDSTQEKSMERLFAGFGNYTPSEFGVELKEKKNGEESPNEMSAETESKYVGDSDENGSRSKPGRPKGSGDMIKRKQKSVSPVQNADASEYTRTVLWAVSALKDIDSVLKPIVLKMKGKSNLRQLSSKDDSDYEDLKFRMLCSFKPFESFNEEIVKSKIKDKINVPHNVKVLYSVTVGRFVEEKGVSPTVEETRQIQAMSYSVWNFNLDRGE